AGLAGGGAGPGLRRVGATPVDGPPEPDHPGPRAPAGAVPPPDRGQPPGPDGVPVPDLLGPSGVLRAVGEPGGPSRVARAPRGDPGADAALGRRVHRAPADRALAGRRGGPPAGPRLPAPGGPGAVRVLGGGAAGVPSVAGVPAAYGVRGGPGPGPAGSRGAAGGRPGWTGRFRGGGLRCGGTVGPGRDPAGRLRRAGADAAALPLERGGGARANADRIVAALSRRRSRWWRSRRPRMNLQRAYAHCEGVTRSRAANFYYGIRLLPPDRR